MSASIFRAMLQWLKTPKTHYPCFNNIVGGSISSLVVTSRANHCLGPPKGHSDIQVKLTAWVSTLT